MVVLVSSFAYRTPFKIESFQMKNVTGNTDFLCPVQKHRENCRFRFRFRTMCNSCSLWCDITGSALTLHSAQCITQYICTVNCTVCNSDSWNTLMWHRRIGTYPQFITKLANDKGEHSNNHGRARKLWKTGKQIMSWNDVSTFIQLDKT